MPEAAIALGSNLQSEWGDRRRNLEEAITQVGALGLVKAVSEFRDTAPVGMVDQPRFLNGALLLETQSGPLELLRALLEVERSMGRDRTKAVLKGPRIVDLDLILFDQLVVSTEELMLPHPEMHQRLFVLEPLAEIAPEWSHPLLRKSVAELLHELNEQGPGRG